MKISFDFDDTLSEDYIQYIAENLIKAGVDVYLITSRTNYPGILQHSDLYEVANKLGLINGKIHFVNGNLKLDKIEELGIDIHFDDMIDEVDNININATKCKAILVGQFNISKLRYLTDEQYGK